MILKKNLKFIITILFILSALTSAHPKTASAQDSVALSVTPPLIKNNMNPGELWKSTVKVINNSPENVTVYVRAIDFKAAKADGAVEFLENKSEDGDDKENSPFLSQWIIFEEPQADLPPYGSKEIPFIINVPENAAPGGHYAAILSGTVPPSDSIEGSTIKISSLLATLILLSIGGEVDEIGAIREFSSEKKYYTEAKANLTVRFENKGNVHLQPTGVIEIHDVFNKKREEIKINQKSDFGNVLPGNIREWNYSWEGDGGILDMGRYRAELYLSFGENGKQTENRVVYFWVLYPKLLIIIGFSIFIFIAVLILLIKLSIRKALRETQGRIEKKSKQNISKASGQKKILSKESKPDSKIIDLKK